MGVHCGHHDFRVIVCVLGGILNLNKCGFDFFFPSFLLLILINDHSSFNP